MKLLMVQQPFANLITLKLKLIETRDWKKKNTLEYRGDVLICASKKSKTPEEVKAIMTPDQWNQFNEIRRKLHHDIFSPRGVAQCVATIIDYRHMTKAEDEKPAFVKFQPYLKSLCLDNIRPVESFPVTGMLGLLNCPKEYEDLIRFD